MKQKYKITSMTIRSASRICCALFDSAFILGWVSSVTSFGTLKWRWTVPPPMRSRAAMPVLAAAATLPLAKWSVFTALGNELSVSSGSIILPSLDWTESGSTALGNGLGGLRDTIGPLISAWTGTGSTTLGSGFCGSSATLFEAKKFNTSMFGLPASIQRIKVLYK